ncbi:regulating synaptic membrane exocytosis protein 1 [Uranotaenia lowii]|uniref:regulating synaptic membrane exocytosis protein 1 n=1 Tax=Uranotaenia lowii TaxID=190385 RepID=UPI002478FED4|nr:regulating synaptic membrane exocytosis protein 1 [Uranotaenia lowii]
MDPEGMHGDVQFLVLKAAENNKLPVNPFIVSKSIDRAVGRIDGANPINDGEAYLLKIRSPNQANKLQNLSELIDGTKINIACHPTLNTCQRVVSCREVIDLSDQEIQENLADQGVTKVYRFIKKVDGEGDSTGIQLVRKSIFKHWSHLSMQTPICLDIFWEMVEFCMDSSYFCFNNTFYQQTSGLAMGSPIASPIAELTLNDLLDDAIEACVTPPLHIKKYVDDLFLVLPPTQVNEIKNVFNAQHENVQFTVEMEENESLPFLDMLLHRNEEGCTIVKLKQRMSQHKTQTNELKRLWEKGYTNEDYAIIQLRQQTALIEHEAAMHHLFDIDKVKIIDRGDNQDKLNIWLRADEVAENATAENTGTFGKLKQTLSSSLLTAQDRVNKMSPRPSLVPETSDLTIGSVPSVTNHSTVNNADVNKYNQGRSGSCRICLKGFKQHEFSKTCTECDQKVCEDCASYSKHESSETMVSWRCSVCRRKTASRIFLPQESTDSILEVPLLESLQRRHSDVKLGLSSQCLGTGNSIALAPPRSPELRRHSDVSPASLKELEKLKVTKSSDTEWRRDHSAAPSRSASPPRRTDLESAASRIASRRPSMRMPRQRSYDEEIKSIQHECNTKESGLILPAPMPRRKSAYDVFAPGATGAVIPTVNDLDSQGQRKPPFKMASSTNDTDEETTSDNLLQTGLSTEDEKRNKRRGSQLPDIPAFKSNQNNAIVPIYQCPALEDLEAPRRQTSLDGDAIKIVIQDVDSGPLCASKRRIVLHKDPGDKAHRTRGFGMRVVGGKTGTDGKLFAYIVWTVPGGPAEKGGLQQGDKILEWSGTSLVDRSFEEVCAIMDRNLDVIELLVEHATDYRMCDLLDDGTTGNSTIQSKIPEASNLGSNLSENDTDKSPSSPTRRKLPKTPEQLQKEKQICGRVQIQVWYHGDKNELVVSLMAGDHLPPRDETSGYGVLPEAFATIEILPRIDSNIAQTEVSSPSLNPIWNATISFKNITNDSLLDQYIEVVLYDLLPQSEPVFLGECKVELQKAFLDDIAVWYRLEDPKQLRGVPAKRKWSSPRNSISGDVTKLIRAADYRFQRSVSDDVDSNVDGSSLLHPDHALIFNRRGSSQSETIEIETYHVGKDFSKSLPGSRRSSFQDQDKLKCNAMSTNSRRRSSTSKKYSDDIKRDFNNFRAEFTRTMSLSRELEQKHSRRFFNQCSNDEPHTPIEHVMPRVENKNEISGDPNIDPSFVPGVRNLGPGQIPPKTGSNKTTCVGELCISVNVDKTSLHLKVIGARKLKSKYIGVTLDTYVKCYLRDGDRLRHKKKSKVFQNALEPMFNHVFKYSIPDLFGRTILVTVWQKTAGFEHNLHIGGIELFFNVYKLKSSIEYWYPLYPPHQVLLTQINSP